MHGPISPNGYVELAFDRLLSPARVIRQAFVLEDLRSNLLQPTVAYDPVARIVRLTPSTTFDPGQTYRVLILTPKNDADPLGLRAIDGATFDPALQPNLVFTVSQSDAGADASAALPPSAPVVDFCADVLPVLTTKCGSSSCHGGTSLPAEGLRLDSPAAVTTTALGRVAVGSNRGPRSAPAAPNDRFAVDMPIVDPGSGATPVGDPGHSWMIYKLLMAVPPSCSPAISGPDGGAMPDAGTTPTSVSRAHDVPWQPLSPDERKILAGLIPGREMPFPTDPAAPIDQAQAPLTCDELELFSLWIAHGAVVPSTCP